MELEQTLVLSTGHLPFRDFKFLVLDDNAPFRCLSHEYGKMLILMFSDDPDEKIDWDDFPNLEPIYNYCKENSIRYINFDQDGELVEEFKKFNW